MHNQKYSLVFFSFLLLCSIVFSQAAFPIMGRAATQEEYNAQREERKALPIQSNQITQWPAGPEIGAQSAILMDMDTGVILYAKNIHERLYPASTTKLLTCLIAAEEGNLDEMVTFSNEAVFSVPSDGSSMGMDVGQSITLEECLYGVMVGSANEAANAAGEAVSGSIEAFVKRMNERARELGCDDSHFCNANGLFDEKHYTSAYDLALIAAAFFKHEGLSKIGNTARYHFEPTPTQPDDFYLKNKHQLITGEVPYPGIMGGKTGYTDAARQTLVTACEQNGMRLVCVVMKEESPYQFSDTTMLFDYGFSNFSAIPVAEADTRYAISNTGFLPAENDVLGDVEAFLHIDPQSTIILPNQTTLEDTSSTVTYGTYEEENKIAEIGYTYQGTYVGKANLLINPSAGNSFHFEQSVANNLFWEHTVEDSGKETINTIFIHVKNVIIFVIIVTVLLIILFTALSMVEDTHFAYHLRKQKKRKWK